MTDATHSQLPLPIEALGSVYFDGSPQNPGSRFERDNQGAYLLDNLRLYLPAQLLARSLPAGDWFQVPCIISPETPYSLLQAYCIQLASPGTVSLRYLPDMSTLELTSCEASNVPFSEYKNRASEIEAQVLNEHHLQARDKLQASSIIEIEHPRIVFLRAVVAHLTGAISEAARLFQHAYKLGHPDGLLASLEMHKFEARNARLRFPNTFRAFDSSDYREAFSQLQDLPDDFLAHRQALLAYCCRHTGDYQRGIIAAQQAIDAGFTHSDILSHKWTFETQLGLDEQALDTAKLHLKHYPTHATAFVDALHSSLLLNDLEKARFYLYGYLIHAQNLNLALKQFFIFFEHSGDFEHAEQIFRALFTKLRAPSADTLRMFAEILLEKGNKGEAMPYLERALAAAPEKSDVVLSYARALAISGKLDEAIRFMESVVHDQKRNDSAPDHFLFITVLSELYRNSGQRETAFQLWPESSELNEPLLFSVGPRPFVEYCYCLAEIGREQEWRRVKSLLLKHFPNDSSVQALELRLSQL